MSDFKMAPGAIDKIIKGREVEAMVLAKAKQIAKAAGPGMVASSTIGARRARASVITATYEAQRAEATNRALTRALAAGRG